MIGRQRPQQTRAWLDSLRGRRRSRANTDTCPVIPPTADRLARVNAFVSKHFTWPGTLVLHRSAFGADILRATLNVVVSPILVIVRMAAWVCSGLGQVRAADWLRRRRLLLRTTVTARVETALLTELLGVRSPDGGMATDPASMSRAILAAPAFREPLRTCGSVAEAQAMADRITGAIGDYTGTRSAIAEFTTALVTLAIGGVVFQALTPGVMSMAPGVAEAVSQGSAIADFPLGSTIGGVWYGVFPVGPSPALIAATVLGLIGLGSVVAAFAGIIADPVQAAVGIHRRRLLRLLDTLDAETVGNRDRPFTAREHFLARIFDLWDAALSLLRVFRG